MTASVEKQGEEAAGARWWRVWDAPTRLMHWLMVTFIALSWWTGENGQLDYHVYSGYAVLWLVLLRLYWGVAGSSTARFANFVRGPRAVVSYARGLHKRDTPPTHGHNPIGGISVLLLLGVMAVQLSLGLFAVDIDGLYSGPLSRYVSFDLGRDIAKLHHTTFNVLLTVIGVHVVAVIFYLAYKRQNLMFPMITGRRKAEAVAGGELQIASFWRLAVGVVLASAIVWLIAAGFYL